LRSYPNFKSRIKIYKAYLWLLPRTIVSPQQIETL